MLPDFANKIKVDYSFCGYFGWTDNNLGLIGETEIPNMYDFISCGANGVINAFAGVQIILDEFNNIENPLSKLFSPIRKKIKIKGLGAL